MKRVKHAPYDRDMIMGKIVGCAEAKTPKQIGHGSTASLAALQHSRALHLVPVFFRRAVRTAFEHAREIALRAESELAADLGERFAAVLEKLFRFFDPLIAYIVGDRLSRLVVERR